MPLPSVDIGHSDCFAKAFKVSDPGQMGLSGRCLAELDRSRRLPGFVTGEQNEAGISIALPVFVNYPCFRKPGILAGYLAFLQKI